MNIFCVGRNYAKHIEELKNARPDRPVIFLKPTGALVTGPTIKLPSFASQTDHEVELVLRVGEIRADVPETRWVEAFAIGLDLTARDVQEQLKAKGLPWTLAKGFRGSAPIGIFQPCPPEGTDWGSLTFNLRVDGVLRQRGRVSDMIFPIPTLLRYLHDHFELKRGDLIFTGTPEGVGPLRSGNRLVAEIESHPHLQLALSVD